MCEYCKSKVTIGKLVNSMCRLCKIRTEIMNLIDERGKDSRNTEISKIGATSLMDILIMQMEEIELMIKKLESTMLDLKIEVLTEVM
jgi:hypothetical protein